jgi:DNA-binding transcriptional regulator of glucitol operon
MKGLAKKNTHVKYESPSTKQSNVMTKIKVFKKVKLQGQRVKVMVSKKVMPEGIHM